MKKVTAIGGIFITVKDPKTLAQWYQQHLGIDFGNNTYAEVKSEDAEGNSVPSTTILSFSKEGSNYFDPSVKPFMFNMRVANLAGLLDELLKEGITPVKPMEEYDYGKFGWIMDPEGNKIELWEPAEDKP